MTPITGRIPTEYVEYTATGAWESLFATGVMPPGSTGVLIQSSGLLWRLQMAPTPPTSNGFTLDGENVLALSTGADLLSLAFKGAGTVRMQFFTGPGGGLPEVIQSSGGGGGGSITNVTASAPLTSSEGATPNVAVVAGSEVGQVLQWDGSSWGTLRQSLTAASLYVDYLFGNDATKQAHNPFRACRTLQSAMEEWANGTNIVCRGPGIYQYTAYVAASVVWIISFPDGGAFQCTFGGPWFQGGADVTINADVIGDLVMYDAANPTMVMSLVVNGNFTGNITAQGINTSVTVNGIHNGRIMDGAGHVTINGNQNGTVNATSASAVITVNDGLCGAVTGKDFTLNLGNAVVESIFSTSDATPILVTANNSTFKSIPRGVTVQPGSTGNSGLFAEAITFSIGTVLDGTVRVLKFSQPTTILYAKVQSDAGTTTCAIKLNGTAITGLGALPIGTVESGGDATALNQAAIGDYLSFAFSGTAGATGVTITLYYLEIVP